MRDWTQHDLRGTFASKPAGLGGSLPVIEKLLNPISRSFSGVVGVCQRYDFVPEMQEAMLEWDAEVRRITQPPPTT